MSEQTAFARVQFVVTQAIGHSVLLWRKQQQRTLAVQDDPGMEGVGRNAPRLLGNDYLSFYFGRSLDCGHGLAFVGSGLLFNCQLNNRRLLRVKAERGRHHYRSDQHQNGATGHLVRPGNGIGSFQRIHCVDFKRSESLISHSDDLDCRTVYYRSWYPCGSSFGSLPLPAE